MKLAPDVDLKVVAARTAGLRRRRPRQPRQRGRAARGAPRQDRGRTAGLRGGDRSADRRAREEARDEHEGARDRRVPRVRPRDRRERAARARSGAQDLDRAARLRRARLHDAAAARGPLPDDARAICSTSSRCCSAGGPPRRSRFGEISTGAQNDLQRATDIARAMVTEFGMSDALGASTTTATRQRVPRHADARGARPLRRRHGAADRCRGQAHPHRRARRGAPHPARQRATPRRAVGAAAREGSDRRRRAAAAAHRCRCRGARQGRRENVPVEIPPSTPA